MDARSYYWTKHILYVAESVTNGTGRSKSVIRDMITIRWQQLADYCY
jgi:hypothetical protein